SLLGGPRDPMSGSLLGCTEPINTGPHHETVQAALHHLVVWSAGGEAPPESPRIELQDGDGDGDEVVIARDERGIALGGVRTPLVDVPISASTGEPAGGAGLRELVEDGDICVLFGTTVPFDQPTLVELHGGFDAYLATFRDAAAEAVAAGFLLQPDADDLVAEAEQHRSLFG
ncbi:MAG: alpha/beta hydrolase domain-containing protein, partial [Actinomycetota bacterium]|nr:alpha/beta hydrolase domain-containing protein [Actinomycetota bacterium]